MVLSGLIMSTILFLRQTTGGARFMLHRTSFTVAFVVGMVAQCGAQWTAPLQPILEALDDAKLSGSLELSGGCSQTYLPSFPQSHALAASEGSTVQKLREILAEAPTMHVSQDPDGAVRMVETGVPADLLNVRISHITFGDYEHNAIFTPNDALHSIFRAPELVSFMSEHGLELPSGASGARPCRAVATGTATSFSITRQRNFISGARRSSENLPRLVGLLELPAR
jgi:hypothetical protein